MNDYFVNIHNSQEKVDVIQTLPKSLKILLNNLEPSNSEHSQCKYLYCLLHFKYIQYFSY